MRKKKEIKALIKFGEKQHIEGMLTGQFYFSNSGKFIEIEKEEMLRGQGDILEGRSFWEGFNVDISDPDTGVPIGNIEKVDLTLGYQGISEIPIFCMTYLKEDEIEYFSEKDIKLSLSEDMKATIRKHFPKADSAVLILDIDTFEKDLKTSLGDDTESDVIKYINYPNSMEYIEYIATGKLTTHNGRKAVQHTFTTNNIYKTLFTKNPFLKKSRNIEFYYLKKLSYFHNCILYNYRNNYICFRWRKFLQISF